MEKIWGYGSMLIVSLTSWPKRIGNVATVLRSLLNQDVQPDVVQVNLSEDEFKNKEDDLPNDLQELVKSDSRVQIEWVKGNDGVFKKIIPTLKKHYGEDYYLLSVDDDWIYRHDYIKIMKEYLEQYESDSFCLSWSKVIGNRMIYKSSCFSNDFWDNLTKEVISTRIDDAYIEYYLKCKGKKMFCFRPENVPDITKRFNPVNPNSHNTHTGSYSLEDVKKANDVIRKIKFM